MGPFYRSWAVVLHTFGSRPGLFLGVLGVLRSSCYLKAQIWSVIIISLGRPKEGPINGGGTTRTLKGRPEAFLSFPTAPEGPTA